MVYSELLELSQLLSVECGGFPVIEFVVMPVNAEQQAIIKDEYDDFKKPKFEPKSDKETLNVYAVHNDTAFEFDVYFKELSTIEVAHGHLSPRCIELHQAYLQMQ